MTWDASVPDGTKTAKDNGPGIRNNWSYIETEIQDDHYFDESATNDGHHKKTEMPVVEDSGIAVDSNKDPSGLSSGMVGMIYMRQKTATECPSKQTNESYYALKDGSTMRYSQLGIRAMVNFKGRTSNGACTINYSHNVTSVSRTAEGKYTVTFSVGQPTSFYIPMGSAMRSSGSPLLIGVQSAASYSTSVNSKWIKITTTSSDSGSEKDCVNAMIAFVGG